MKSNVLQFKPKPKKFNITISVDCEILEDGSAWWRYKLNTEQEWSEWEKVKDDPNN